MGHVPREDIVHLHPSLWNQQTSDMRVMTTAQNVDDIVRPKEQRSLYSTFNRSKRDGNLWDLK